MKRINTTIQEQLLAGHAVSTFTSGSSMEPLLYDHSTHVVAVPMKGPLKMGELPIYRRPDGRYVIHRVVGVGDGFYLTRGDNCMEAERIPADWVLGRVEEIVRKGRRIRVTDRGYRLYVWLWLYGYPLRRFLRRARGFLKGLADEG